MHKKVNKLILVYLACFGLPSTAQKQTIKPDLLSTDQLQLVNRDANIKKNERGIAVIHLNNKAHDGIAWIKNFSFGKGVIEFDVKGKNIVQQSFVGIAFHGINDSTFDAVYFRPFNFLSADTARRKHSVQYISMPKYEWFILRDKYPGRYEDKLTKNINPEDWFHAKLIVNPNSISVYVNGESEASLVVKPLSSNETGKIGFWVGNDSDGDFSNLTIQNN